MQISTINGALVNSVYFNENSKEAVVMFYNGKNLSVSFATAKALVDSESPKFRFTIFTDNLYINLDRVLYFKNNFGVKNATSIKITAVFGPDCELYRKFSFKETQIANSIFAGLDNLLKK